MAPEQCSSLLELKQAVEQCRRCRLHETRTKVVFGQGPERTRLMLVGEAPGRNEDLQGLPFVGRSGELLTKMLRAINIERREVFITSVVKCRPPKNRTPKSDEIAACLPWLKRQIGLIQPSIILCLGTTSAHALLDTDAPMAKLRGRFHQLPEGFWPEGIRNPSEIKVAVTYHPAYLLRFGGARQKALKLEAWHDLQMVEREYKNL
jgi:DNA polymerase